MADQKETTFTEFLRLLIKGAKDDHTFAWAVCAFVLGCGVWAAQTSEYVITHGLEEVTGLAKVGLLIFAVGSVFVWQPYKLFRKAERESRSARSEAEDALRPRLLVEGVAQGELKMVGPNDCFIQLTNSSASATVEEISVRILEIEGFEHDQHNPSPPFTLLFPTVSTRALHPQERVELNIFHIDHFEDPKGEEKAPRIPARLQAERKDNHPSFHVFLGDKTYRLRIQAVGRNTPSQSVDLFVRFEFLGRETMTIMGRELHSYRVALRFPSKNE